MEKSSVTRALNLSNWLIGLLMVKDILFMMFLFFFNDLTDDYLCGMGMFLFSIYAFIYCLGIPTCIQIFKATKDVKGNNGGWIVAGALFLIGLLMILMLMPFFPFLFLMGTYIFSYPAIKPEKRGTFGVSLFLFFVASGMTFGGFLIRNATGLWLTIPLGIIISIVFITSHSMHITVNNQAMVNWSPIPRIQRARPAPRGQQKLDQKPRYSYYEPPKKAPIKEPPPVVIKNEKRDGGEYDQRILDTPIYHENDGKGTAIETTPPVIGEPVKNESENKPRVLDAPPGYD